MHLPQSKPTSNDPYLFVVGDSHVSVFSGVDGLQPLYPEPAASALPGVRVARLGPFLAHSVTRAGHRVQQLLTRAVSEVATSTTILLSFGEIDCRDHVVPIAHKTGRTPRDVATDLAQRFAPAARALLPHHPLAFLATPVTPSEHLGGPHFPEHYTVAELEEATAAFNTTLAHEAQRLGCAFVSFEAAMREPDGRRREACFQDIIHCRVAVLPEACEALIGARLVPASRVAELRSAAQALSRVPWRPAMSTVYYPPPVVADPLPRKHDAARAVEAALLDRAALECSWAGATHVALYGAGQHTRRTGVDYLRRRGLAVTAILDDSPQVATLCDVPVLRPTDELPRIDALVISSDSREDELTARAVERFADTCVRIVRIYSWREALPRPQPDASLEAASAQPAALPEPPARPRPVHRVAPPSAARVVRTISTS